MFETDETLIRRILQGKDREAGELLVERHYKRIYKEIYLKTSDEELAKDLTQEAFIQLSLIHISEPTRLLAKDLTQEAFIQILKNLYQFDSKKASFKTWITRIACNKVIDYMRSRQHHEMLMTEILDDYDKEDAHNLEERVTNRMATQRVEQLLEKEEVQNQKIFNLKAQQGYTFEEVSTITGVTKTAVKNRYYSMVRKMRKELSDYE